MIVNMAGSATEEQINHVVERIKDCEARMNGAGRLLVRKSGTEPVIRVMAEADDERLVRSVVSDVVAALQEVVA